MKTGDKLLLASALGCAIAIELPSREEAAAIIAAQQAEPAIDDVAAPHYQERRTGCSLGSGGSEPARQDAPLAAWTAALAAVLLRARRRSPRRMAADRR